MNENSEMFFELNKHITMNKSNNNSNNVFVHTNKQIDGNNPSLNYVIDENNDFEEIKAFSGKNNILLYENNIKYLKI